ncbi:MAG: alkaline phosphatase [Deltaproteobacteria bacterium]|nr:alkaline phosphatase [Deltaproteobacteria bacterium]
MPRLQKAMALAVSFTLSLPSVVPAVGPTTPEEWYEAGKQAVKSAEKLKKPAASAKNVILFIGDGMGVSTVTAARILEGQLRGENGEENLLSFEKFPYVALSKVYSVNQQTPDSAPTMTAMVTGVKTNDGILAVNQYAVRGDHTTAAGNELTTILELAEDAGKSTGVVSTARITHATPAACYAHTVERDWESDANLSAAAKAANFPDIARQLVEFSHGDGLEVALGGGRSNFLPDTTDDPEDAGRKGSRLDGRNLVNEWLGKANSAYAWNTTQFNLVDPATTDHFLGLFERSHMEYEADRALDTGGEPSLSDMTGKAIDILAKNKKKGFFLMVESGRIDHAHHASNASRALSDTIEFAKAIKTAVDKTDPKKTLIVVSADHSHVFTIAGYPKRGNPILGKVVEPDKIAPDYAKDLFNLPYTTLSYANGPGYTGTSNAQAAGPKTFPHNPTSYTTSAVRPDLTAVDTAALNYLQESTVPLGAETHAGEDVAIYATGPNSHLFHGVMEQNVIYHVMNDALKLIKE